MALRSVTIPSTVTELGACLFSGCTNLSEVIFLGGKRLFNQEFFDCCVRREELGLLDQEALDEMLFDEDGDFTFHGCQMITVKISISWAVTERLAKLPRECMLSVEEKIHTLRRLELLQDGDVLACFPVVRMAPGDEAEDNSDDEDDDKFELRDTNHETARSLYQVLQLIAFHELKESSILLELAIWKSKIDEPASVAREDCRIAIPDPAKSLIMDYSVPRGHAAAPPPGPGRGAAEHSTDVRVGVREDRLADGRLGVEELVGAAAVVVFGGPTRLALAQVPPGAELLDEAQPEVHDRRRGPEPAGVSEEDRQEAAGRRALPGGRTRRAVPDAGVRAEDLDGRGREGVGPTSVAAM
ncbi:hypothetical protein THAOC_27331, partial [Thalassiosira oceanica]